MPSQLRSHYVTEALLHVIITANQLGGIIGIMEHYAKGVTTIKKLPE